MMWNKNKKSVRFIRLLTSFILITCMFVTGTVKDPGDRGFDCYICK